MASSRWVRPVSTRLLARTPSDVLPTYFAAIHDRGWLSPTGSLPSLPRTCLTAGYEAQEIPSCALEAIKRGLRAVYPELVDKEIKETRLCWYVARNLRPFSALSVSWRLTDGKMFPLLAYRYSDRESGDFLFDWHPKYRSLFVAAGGSGHAYSASWASPLSRSCPTRR